MTTNTRKPPSTAVGRRRLLKLADLLTADARSKTGIRFNLKVIAERSVPRIEQQSWGGTFEDKDFRPKDIPTVDCGTTACAWGLATLSGAFKRSGLRYRIDASGFTPIYRRSKDMAAARVFFDLSVLEMEWLFTPNYYHGLPIEGAIGERVVAKRIRDFVAGRASP